MRAALLFVLSSSCTVIVGELQPRPNLPPLMSRAVVLELDKAVPQDVMAEGTGVDSKAHFMTLRGDLKRAFQNAMPGPSAPGQPLTLQLMNVEPQLARNGALLVVRLRYRGVLRDGERVLSSFAGTVEKSCPNIEAFPECFSTNIERLYEQTFKELSPVLQTPERMPAAAPAPLET